MHGWSATPSLPEPNPYRSTDGRAWRLCADSTGSWQMTRAWFNSVQTIRVSTLLFLNRTVSQNFSVLFSLYTV
jgi:hypothetical protein